MLSVRASAHHAFGNQHTRDTVHRYVHTHAHTQTHTHTHFTHTTRKHTHTHTYHNTARAQTRTRAHTCAHTATDSGTAYAHTTGTGLERERLTFLFSLRSPTTMCNNGSHPASNVRMACVRLSSHGRRSALSGVSVKRFSQLCQTAVGLSFNGPSDRQTVFGKRASDSESDTV